MPFTVSGLLTVLISHPPITDTRYIIFNGEDLGIFDLEKTKQAMTPPHLMELE